MNSPIRKNTQLKPYCLLTMLLASPMAFSESEGLIKTETCADQVIQSTAPLVSYEFNETELSSVLQLASLSAQKNLIGIELVEGKIISASATKVNVTEFIDALLLVNGFAFEEQGNNWVISKN